MNYLDKDKILFTPGPLTTSLSVKKAMLRDLGSRDFEFIKIVKEVRGHLLKIGQVDEKDFTTVLLQGAGTFSIEAVLSSTVEPQQKILVVVNGAYSKRICDIAAILKIETVIVKFLEEEKIDLNKIEEALKNHPNISHLCMVHCETSTGMFNPIKEVGELAFKYQKKYFVDAMSTYGAFPLSLKDFHIDYLVSSANKCIEGVPGFSFVLCKKESLAKTEGLARSLSFDLYAQEKGLTLSGQFRFTPPTHTLLAFHQALIELEAEGGPQGRGLRYQGNYQLLVKGMRELGFKDFLEPQLQGYIITAFRYPRGPQFHFETFYQKLNDRGFVIYPGKVGHADCFRIGNIGRIFKEDIQALLMAIQEIVKEMKFDPSSSH